MRILVVSDSHGNKTSVSYAYFKEDPDAIIHLGDGFDDIPKTIDIPCYRVKGNCDSRFSQLNDAKVIELEGVRIFCTHGYVYNIDSGLTSLYLAASEYCAELALFGHTHKPYEDIYEEGISVINPGSIFKEPYNYGILVVRDGKFKYYQRNLSGELEISDSRFYYSY